MTRIGVESTGVAAQADVLAVQSVPLRALMPSLTATTAAVCAAVFWPEALVNQEILAGGLALIPALLLAHYRGWPVVSVLLGAGLVALTIMLKFDTAGAPA